MPTSSSQKQKSRTLLWWNLIHCRGESFCEASFCWKFLHWVNCCFSFKIAKIISQLWDHNWILRKDKFKKCWVELKRTSFLYIYYSFFSGCKIEELALWKVILFIRPQKLGLNYVRQETTFTICSGRKVNVVCFLTLFLGLERRHTIFYFAFFM